MKRGRRTANASSGGRKNFNKNASTAPAQDMAASAISFRRFRFSKVWITVTFVVAAVGCVGLTLLLRNVGRHPSLSNSGAVTFVGSKICVECHEAEGNLWLRSQHNHAMDHATDSSVLGDFDEARFEYFGVRSRFFRRDGKFFIETDGPDGELDIFEVKYTFGIDPLQQYLVEFSDGRVQALPIAWDTRQKEAGGQRWFHLYPNEEIKHGDALHWTGLNQNWNFMCAECHSTGVHKNYDPATARFSTTFAEISVGCEACHGQGSRHLAWAREQKSWWPFGRKDDPNKGLPVVFDERVDITWSIDARSGKATRRIAPARLRKEVETCGLCHARRGIISEDWIPGRSLSDTHVVSTLSRGLFQADGQMLDEVYNYASFKQSRMFAAGVTCSDCHEPHGGTLRSFREGSVCLQCHSADKYAVAGHQHHEGANPKLSCASCHMPERTYMVIDRRHDHSFRIPRPDVSAKLGTSNACNDCHTDRNADWAASQIERWYGPNRKGLQNYADAFQAALGDRSNAAALLRKVLDDHGVPAFARASALTELAPHLARSDIELARQGLLDSDPMVRIGGLNMLESLPATQIWPLVSPLLSDSILGVRIKAAEVLAAAPLASQPLADRERFDRAATEFVAAQRLNADRPEARSALGSFYARRGLYNEAQSEFRAALQLSPQYAPGAINLADLYRQQGRDEEGERVLRAAIDASPRDAALYHVLGLTLTRLKRNDEALSELRLANNLEPESARYLYVYAIALNASGHREEAIAALKEFLNKHGEHRDILLALTTFSRDAGDFVTALEYAERLAHLAPDDQNTANLVRTLRALAQTPKQ